MDRFPVIEPYDQGMLDVGEGHSIYWETSGNPSGTPALMIHGGPGWPSIPGNRRNWDPSLYRIIQMDQRNAGRSTPPASDPRTPLTGNTTQHLMSDIERLREELGIERWVVYGSSWGATVAVTYAEQYPRRVRALILVFMQLARRRDLLWLYHEMGRYFPEEWNRFADLVPGGSAGADLVAGYNRLLNESGDEHIQRTAAQHWCDWEDAVRGLEPNWSPFPRFENPDFRMCFARLVTHYFSHGAFLEEDQILRDAHRLDGIPGVVIHGRLDTCNPVDMPWLLTRQWTDAELQILPGVGHNGGPQTLDSILSATTRFADAK